MWDYESEIRRNTSLRAQCRFGCTSRLCRSGYSRAIGTNFDCIWRVDFPAHFFTAMAKALSIRAGRMVVAVSDLLEIIAHTSRSLT